MTKVVYVHLVFEKKDYFFGSIAAIYDHLSADRIVPATIRSGTSGGKRLQCMLLRKPS